MIQLALRFKRNENFPLETSDYANVKISAFQTPLFSLDFFEILNIDRLTDIYNRKRAFLFEMYLLKMFDKDKAFCTK